MVQEKGLDLLLKMLSETIGNVDEVCNEISESAIQLAVTPLESWTDYPTVQRAIWVMMELKMAFETLKPNVEVSFPDEDK